MAHQVPEVITDHVDLSKVRVDGPTILHVLTIDSSPHLVSPSLALHLEVVTQGYQVESHLLEDIHLEGTFQDHIG